MTEPYKFQKRGVRRMEHFGHRALLADEMGLGKTIQTLWLIKRNKKILTPAVVVCPATLKWVWEDEAKKHIRWPALVLSGQTPYDVFSGPYHPNIIIINYDIVQYWEKYIIKKIKPKLLVVEECHYISNRGTRKAPIKRTKSVVRIGRKAPHVIGISGTPFMKVPKQLFNIANLIDAETFPSYPAFAFRYCNRRKTPWGWDDTGRSHLPELHKKLKKTMLVRRTKAQVFDEFPDKVFQVVPLDIEKRSHYEKQKRKLDAWLQAQVEKAKKKGASKKRALKMAKAKGLIRVTKLLGLTSKLKMKSVCTWVDDFLVGTDEKVVLVCQNVAIVEQLLKRYRRQALAIYGAVHMKDRPAIVRAFQKKDKYRIMIINKAGREGITLTAARHVAVIQAYSIPGALQQFIDRVHRIGQTRTVFVTFLVAKGTPEERMYKSIQRTAGDAAQVLDGKKTSAFDLYDEYLKELTLH